MLGSCCSFAVIVARTEGMSTPLTSILGAPARQTLLHPHAARFQLHLTLRLNHAQHVPCAFAAQTLAGCLPCERLILPNVRRDTEAFPSIEACVERHDRNTGALRLSDLACQRIGCRERQRDSVNALIDGILDQDRLAVCILVVRVDQLDIILRCCGLSAPTDDIPEGLRPEPGA